MLELNFSPFPELRTERLLLRKLVKADGPQMLFLRSDDKVMQYIDREKTKTLEEAELFIERLNAAVDANESIMWAITMANDPATLIGTICYWRMQLQHYRAEVGYVLHPGYWNRGIMHEALMAVSRYGFEGIKLHSIEAHINPENVASGKVLEKAGFTREAYFKENYFFRDRFLDTAIYSLLKR
ncbi:MAG TPA: GNAT family protein [Ferruginibacter sp.]|nr:GNAT family protein [Ferruginibacter sp.]